MDKLLAVFSVLRQGNALTDPQLWRDRELLARALAVFLMAIAQAAKLFGYDIGADHDTVTAIAGGIAGAVWLFIRTATDPQRGLPAKPAPEPPRDRIQGGIAPTFEKVGSNSADPIPADQVRDGRPASTGPTGENMP